MKNSWLKIKKIKIKNNNITNNIKKKIIKNKNIEKITIKLDKLAQNQLLLNIVRVKMNKKQKKMIIY